MKREGSCRIRALLALAFRMGSFRRWEIGGGSGSEHFPDGIRYRYFQQRGVNSWAVLVETAAIYGGWGVLSAKKIYVLTVSLLGRPR